MQGSLVRQGDLVSRDDNQIHLDLVRMEIKVHACLYAHVKLCAYMLKLIKLIVLDKFLLDASFSRSRERSSWESAHPYASGSQVDPLHHGSLRSIATRDFGEFFFGEANVQQPQSHQQPMANKFLLFFYINQVHMDMCIYAIVHCPKYIQMFINV
jgi:hypothetical protein